MESVLRTNEKIAFNTFINVQDFDLSAKGIPALYAYDGLVCGTAGYHIGKPPHPGTRKILDSYGISYTGMKASKLEKHHLKNFDGIVAMDEENLSDILRLRDKNATAWVKLLSEFVNNKWVSVPDPYYTCDFELTYRLVTDGCNQLLETISGGDM